MSVAELTSSHPQLGHNPCGMVSVGVDQVVGAHLQHMKLLEEEEHVAMGRQTISLVESKVDFPHIHLTPNKRQ